MAYQKQKFLGATVTSCTTNTNWNEQGATITIYLVEDPADQDDFLLKAGSASNYQGSMMGTPASFEVGGFRYDGLITYWQELDSIDARPTFEVTLSNPVFILERTQVILSNYVGPVNDSVFNSQPQGATFNLSNVLNPYGYLEQGGSNFGGALLNADGNSYSDTGLFWEGPAGLRNVLQTLTSQFRPANNQQNWGSYLNFFGNTYFLDLSAIPTAPSFYRIGNSVNCTLMELISTVCSDAGVSFLTKLEIRNGTGPHRIYFQIADLVSVPDLDAIANFISGQTNVSSNNVGQELRTTDYSQAMIFGGDISSLSVIQNTSSSDPAISPFWGFDINGNPIVGAKPNGTYYADDDYQMVLNASEIADVMGSVGLGPYYPSSILELRAALASYDSWAAYIWVNKQTFAQSLGIAGAVNTDFSLLEGNVVIDFVNDSIELAQSLGEMNSSNHWESVSRRVYQYVHSQASTYYGRQFVVRFPFPLQTKIIPDSNTILYNTEPADSAYLPEGSAPLGLNYINEKYFLSPDGQFYPFMRFQNTTSFGSISSLQNGQFTTVTADTSSTNDDTVVQPDAYPYNTAIYMKYDVVNRNLCVQNGQLAQGPIIYINNSAGLPVPAMVVTITDAVFAQAPDTLGGVADIAAMLGVDEDNVQNAAQFRADSFPMRLYPPAFYPNGVAIAVRSNQYVYGPWGRWVSDGAAQILERDETLTPWDCGGYNVMNQVALAKIQNVPFPNRVKERGTVTMAGFPIASVGDVLIEGGPTISNISIQISISQITTTYAMETYVPRVGVFIRENADRMKRYGRLAQQMRRSIRTLLLQKQVQNNISLQNQLGFNFGTSYAVRQQTPHAVIAGNLVYDKNLNGYVPMVYSETYRESVANICAHNDQTYQQSACMGWDGLFRAISTNIAPTGNYTLPSYQPVDKVVINKTPVTNSGIQPFLPHSDMSWYSYGNTYAGLNGRKNQPDTTNARIMGLRGPMVMAGWGYDIVGNPVPNAAASGSDLIMKYSNQFASNYLINSQNWLAGAIDLRWDKWRGVWTMPGIQIGQLSGGPLSPGNVGRMILYADVSTQLNETVPVTHFFNFGTIAASSKLMCMMHNFSNKLIIMAADCSQSS